MAFDIRPPEFYDFSEIADAMRVTKRAIERRASKETWLFETRPVRGGQKRLFAATALPAEVRVAVLANRTSHSTTCTPARTRFRSRLAAMLRAAAHALDRTEQIP